MASWRAITIEEIRFTPAELALLQNIQGSSEVGAEILANVVGEFRDAIAAGGYSLGAEGLVPDIVRSHVINRTRWLWLCEFPQLKSMQTEARSKLNESAEKALRDVSSQKLSVPSPDATTTVAAGNWNSENKIVPRGHPIAKPGTQFQQKPNDYANPDGPSDSTPV